MYLILAVARSNLKLINAGHRQLVTGLKSVWGVHVFIVFENVEIAEFIELT